MSTAADGAADSARSLPLARRHVVVTRPAAQAGALAEAIRAAGGEPVLFPVLAISDVDDPSAVVAVAQRLEDYALAIFVSANAVNAAMKIIAPLRPWPAQLRAATLGKSSERELARHGITGVIAPSTRFDSEALLELPALQSAAVGGRRVVIFRGDGGRELLGDALTARGASVDYVCCYHRSQAASDTSTLAALWRRGRLDAITVTSSEGLRHLHTLLEGWPALLRETPLFVTHARIVAQAQALGMDNVVATGPGDQGLIEALVKHFRPEHGSPQ